MVAVSVKLVETQTVHFASCIWQVFFFVYALEYNVTHEIVLSYPINPKAREKIAGIV